MPAPFDGRTFHNENDARPKGLRAILQWQLKRSSVPWPDYVTDPPQPPPPHPPAGGFVVTFINHATFLIQTGACTILTDPVWSMRASPFTFMGPKRHRNPGLALDLLPPIDLVLLSHNHYDHLDTATLKTIAERHQPVFVTHLGVGALLKQLRIPAVHELDWWDKVEAGGLSITSTPAQHFSGRGLFDRNHTLWGGFSVRLPNHHLLFAGDSAYAKHFTEIRDRLGAPDLALLPIGAYRPRWIMQGVHMDPDEAVQAHLDLGSRQSIAMHFGTFQLTDEGIDEPVTELAESLRKRGIEHSLFRALGFGESLTVL